jgi:DNA adenine methylase
VISNSDTPETREIYSAFNLHAFSVRRSVSAKSRDMAGEVIGVLIRRLRTRSCALAARRRMLSADSDLDRVDMAAGFDNGSHSDEPA